MIRLRNTRKLSDDTGAVAVEFGLLLPLLLLIIFSFIQFGIAFNAKMALSAGAREGVRTLALNTGADPVGDAEARTKAASAPLDGDLITVTPTSCPNGADRARVVATYEYNVSVNPAYSAFVWLTDFFGSPFPSTLTLRGVGEMRCLG